MISVGDIVSRETSKRLEELERVVAGWSRTAGLVAAGDTSELWIRHIVDSLGLVFEIEENALWVDVGSGGGFPVLPLASCASLAGFEATFVAVESDRRKASALDETARRIGVRVSTLRIRMETLPLEQVTVVSARAVAPVGRLLELLQSDSRGRAEILLLKGVGYGSEITKSCLAWHVRYRAWPHPFGPQGRVVAVVRRERANL